ncbi:Smr/MutS family protein [Metamycoplasma auris]|uniref:Smr domain-containing protein n=1 Tax=Metamycoplasma auris TaxID=51363 RepID=A0A2W7G5F5_9BACT|nr:Smr/MutS family protein [Metamycoplasma auris]PZW01497.1 Smr domain-containing protein [Metamycoplasma auris]
MNFDYSFIIDLHGQDSIEATSSVLNALFAFDENKNYEYFDIITGNGSGALKFVVSDLLETENYRYKFLNQNQSIIRVYRKKR